MPGQMQLSRLGLAALAALVLCAGTAFGDPLVGRAWERCKAGDAEEAALLLRSWMEINPGAPGAARLFDEYFSIEQDFPRLVNESRSFLKEARGRAGTGAQLLRIARLFDVAGRVEEARDAYLAAAQNGASDEALLSAFLLSLEMNDSDSMRTTLAGLTGRGGSAELLLGALAALQAGDVEKARGTLLGLAGQTGDPGLAVRALWVLYATATARGDKAEKDAVRGRLKARFPAAPETALTAEGAQGVVQSPGPDPFAVAAAQTAAASSTAASSSTAGGAAAAVVPDAAAAAPSAKATFSVQAGSFRMKENADDLVAELTKRGFTPVVIHDTPQGKERFRVLAGAGLGAEEARAVMARLSQAGFSGFLVSDK